MAKQKTHFDILKEKAAKADVKESNRIPVLACKPHFDELYVTEYVALSKEEKKIKQRKDEIADLLRPAMQKEFIRENVQGEPATSVRFESDKASILFTVQDRYAKVSEEMRKVLISLDLGDMIESQVEIKLDEADNALREKIAKLIVNNLTANECKQILVSKDTIAKGSLARVFQENKSEERVAQIMNLINPTQSLKAE